MRGWAHAIMARVIRNHHLRGEVLEVGGCSEKACALDLFPTPRFVYYNLDIKDQGVPGTVLGDICECPLPDHCVDVVVCSDVFEHLAEPWAAAQEIGRLLRPGGMACIFTVFSWRYHPCPIDYWRFSPQALEYLFSKAGLSRVTGGLDGSWRRRDLRGLRKDKSDAAHVDKLGGWRENWNVYYIGKKDAPA